MNTSHDPSRWCIQFKGLFLWKYYLFWTTDVSLKDKVLVGLCNQIRKVLTRSVTFSLSLLSLSLSLVCVLVHGCVSEWVCVAGPLASVKCMFHILSTFLIPPTKKCHMTCQVGSSWRTVAAATRDEGRRGFNIVNIWSLTLDRFVSRYISNLLGQKEQQLGRRHVQEAAVFLRSCGSGWRISRSRPR